MAKFGKITQKSIKPEFCKRLLRNNDIIIMYEIISAFTILFLTYWSGYFSSTEIAMFSLPATKVKAYHDHKDPRKRLIANLLSRPQDLLVTVFIVNTLINILIQNVTSSSLGATSSWTLRVGIPLFITLVFGEIIPKYIAMQYNVSLAYRVAPTVDFLTRFLAPLRRWTVSVTAPISRVMFFFLKKEKAISKDELEHALKTSQQFDVLNKDEAKLIAGYLDLQDSQVREIMRPRDDVLFYDIHDPLTKLTYLFVDQECTRLPVCDKVLDEVLGVITANQYFIHRHNLSSPEDLRKVLLKPFFVPETTPARLLFEHMSERNETFSLVVDEYGSISGLVTQEDLVEEVVGEISDQRDQHSLYSLSDANTMIANGKLGLDELEDIFGVFLDSPNNMLTIGGWLTEQLGDIPQVGTKYETNDFLFQVLSAEPHRLKTVYIHKKTRNTKKKEKHGK